MCSSARARSTRMVSGSICASCHLASNIPPIYARVSAIAKIEGLEKQAESLRTLYVGLSLKPYTHARPPLCGVKAQTKPSRDTPSQSLKVRVDNVAPEAVTMFVLPTP